jgi:hypothetical protein
MLEWIRLEMLRPTRIDARGDGQRLEPIDDALVEVVGQTDRDDERGEHDRLDHDPWHQELAVVRALHRDRPAEDVGEEQRVTLRADLTPRHPREPPDQP